MSANRFNVSAAARSASDYRFVSSAVIRSVSDYILGVSAVVRSVSAIAFPTPSAVLWRVLTVSLVRRLYVARAESSADTSAKRGRVRSVANAGSIGCGSVRRGATGCGWVRLGASLRTWTHLDAPSAPRSTRVFCAHLDAPVASRSSIQARCGRLSGSRDSRSG